MIDTESSEPKIKGTNITVKQVMNWLAEGKRINKVISDNPQLTIQDVLDCIEYTAKS